MAKTKIEWATDSSNIIVGCEKCSDGCKHCYAERMALRLAAMGQVKYKAVTNGKGWNGKLFFDKDTLDSIEKHKKPRRFFVNSMGDTFHDNADLQWIAQILSVAAQNPQHVFIILTKRAKRMHEYFKLAARPPRNVWCGVTVVNQDEANEKIPLLMQVPAAVRFISVEPMLGEIDLTDIIDEETEQYEDHINAPVLRRVPEDDLKYHGKTINWVICGSESGPNRRPAEIEWIRSLRDQCKVYDVPFMLKQMEVDGKLVKMPTLDGVIHDEHPVIKG